MPPFTIHDLAATIDARAASGGEASYTRKLLAAVPIADPAIERAKRLIEGEIPSAVRPVGKEPAIHSMREVEPGHWVAIEAEPLLGAA